MKIFLVEDNRVIRENLIATLGELTGAEVVGFADSERQALEWFRANPKAWSLAILDIRLREGNGVNVLRALQPLDPSRPIVVLTNYAVEGIRQTCLALGAARVFDKSNELEQLLEFVIEKCGPRKIH